MITLYLITLIIAPQLWIEPFVGLRTDFVIYPLWLVYLASKGKAGHIFKLNIQDGFFLLMIFWIVVTSIVNETNERTLIILLNYSKWFVLYRMTAVTLAQNDGVIKVARSLTFIIFIIVIESIQQRYHPLGIGWAGQTLDWVDRAVLEAGGVGRTRWINIFDGPGVFVVMFTLILPFILIHFDKSFPNWTRLFNLILLIPLMAAIWFTGSRGGFLATLAIFGCYFVASLKISIPKVAIGGAILVIAYIMAPTHLTSIKDENRSAQHRVDMWIEGIEMLEQNPVFGIGKGNFKIYTGRLIAHSSIIEIMGEIGGIGLFFWIGLYYLSFKTIYLYTLREPDAVNFSYAKGLAICLIGYLVNSMFVTLEYETLYFVLGITRSLSLNKNLDLKLFPKDIGYIFAIMFTFYLVMKVFISIYY